MSGLKVEIGPGGKRISPEWINVDIKPGPNVDHVCDWGMDRLPFEDGTVELLYASHCLEHIHFTRTKYALAEAFRVIQPGGCFEVWVPNFDYLVECFLANKYGDDWRMPGAEDTPFDWFQSRLFTYETDMHKAVFTFKSLALRLRDAGFIAPTWMTREETRTHDHGPISLGIRAFKRT